MEKLREDLNKSLELILKAKKRSEDEEQKALLELIAVLLLQKIRETADMEEYEKKVRHA